MIRPLPLLLLAMLVCWPAAADAQGRMRGGAPQAAPRGGPVQQAAPRGGVQRQGGRGRAQQQTIIVVPAFGYGYGYGFYGAPVFNAGTVLPFNSYDIFSEWPEPVVASPFRSASTGSNDSYSSALVAELGRLSHEVEQLRVQTARALPAPVAPPASGGTAPNAAAAPPAPPNPERIVPPTVLVLREGRRVETRNYAIVGDMFWVLDEGKSQKIPLADIDREASEKENRGFGTRLPLE
jgi:hypothetical protein